MNKPTIDRKEASRLLADDSTFGTIAHILAFLEYGESMYEMEPTELFANLEDDFKTTLADDVVQKLQAILLATTTDAFFQDPESFRHIANTLLEGEPGFLGMDNLTVAEILWAAYEVSLNHPGAEFTPAVEKLIDSEIKDEGQDLEDLDDAQDSPAFDAVIKNIREDFAAQMSKLGLPVVDLPSAG
jgi:hypothetical protein